MVGELLLAVREVYFVLMVRVCVLCMSEHDFVNPTDTYYTLILIVHFLVPKSLCSHYSKHRYTTN